MLYNYLLHLNPCETGLQSLLDSFTTGITKDFQRLLCAFLHTVLFFQTQPKLLHSSLKEHCPKIEFMDSIKLHEKHVSVYTGHKGAIKSRVYTVFNTNSVCGTTLATC